MGEDKGGGQRGETKGRTKGRTKGEDKVGGKRGRPKGEDKGGKPSHPCYHVAAQQLNIRTIQNQSNQNV